MGNMTSYLSDEYAVMGNYIVSYFGKETGEYEVPVNFPSGPIDSIGGGAFRGSSFYEVKIPKEIKYIDGNAFLDCYNLRKVYIDGKKDFGKAAVFGTEKVGRYRDGLAGITPTTIVFKNQPFTKDEYERLTTCSRKLEDGYLLVNSSFVNESLSKILRACNLDHYYFDDYPLFRFVPGKMSIEEEFTKVKRKLVFEDGYSSISEYDMAYILSRKYSQPPKAFMGKRNERDRLSKNIINWYFVTIVDDKSTVSENGMYYVSYEVLIGSWFVPVVYKVLYNQKEYLVYSRFYFKRYFSYNNKIKSDWDNPTVWEDVAILKNGKVISNTPEAKAVYERFKEQIGFES